MPLHPGGTEWLERMRGCDATEAFEAHHVDGKKAERVLRPYLVRAVSPGEFQCGDRFEYADDGFWRVLRQRVLQRLLEAEGGVGGAGSHAAADTDTGAAAAGADAAADAAADATTGATSRHKAAPAAAMPATGATAEMRAACALVVAQFLGAHCLACATGSAAAAALAGYLQVRRAPEGEGPEREREPLTVRVLPACASACCETPPGTAGAMRHSARTGRRGTPHNAPQ
jgi:hypothetical protein